MNGLIAFSEISAYVGTKFALEGFLSESLDNELEPFGIKVIVIEPGAIGNNFMKGSVLSKRERERPSVFLLRIIEKI